MKPSPGPRQTKASLTASFFTASTADQHHLFRHYRSQGGLNLWHQGSEIFETIARRCQNNEGDLESIRVLLGGLTVEFRRSRPRLLSGKLRRHRRSGKLEPARLLSPATKGIRRLYNE